MLTCLKRFKATNVHFILKTLAPGKSTGFFTLFRYFTPFGYSNSRICIIRISMLRIIPLVFRRFPRISTIVRLSVTVVFRGQKDRDQRSRPTRKLYDNEGNRFYGTRRACKLSLRRFIIQLRSWQLFSKTASLLS